MATLEYIRSEQSTEQESRISHLSGMVRHGRLGPKAAASVAMAAWDMVIIWASFEIALLLLRNTIAAKLKPDLLGQLHTYWETPAYAVSLAWFALAYVLVARRYGHYNTEPLGSGFHDIRLVVQACFNSGLLLFGALYIFRADHVSRSLMVLLVGTSSVALCLRRRLWRGRRIRQYEQGMNLRNVVILGTDRLSVALAQHIQSHQWLGYRFMGFIARPGAEVSTEISPAQVLGGLERVQALARQDFIDELVIAEFYPLEDAIALVEDARNIDIDIRAIAGYYGNLATHAPVEYLGIFPVSPLHRRKPNGVGRACKRMMDVVLSSAALFAMTPLMVAIALSVKLGSPGPALYVSDRIGKRGRVFRCFKFRTMVKNAEKMRHELSGLNERDGILFKCSNDPRVTRLGRFLRKYSLDELPQFLNVLRGEMSVVGPRPPIATEVEKYELEHFRRLEVLPGMTGLWQVQARDNPSFAKYIELDIAYVENWSFWLDLKILIQTAGVVLKGTGV